MKTCRLCKEEKEEIDFRVSNKKTGKMRSECRDCERVLNREYHLNNSEKISERHKNNRALRGVDYARKLDNKHKNKREKYKEENKEKIKAHEILNSAIKSGTVIRFPCKECGNVKVDAHHEDYSKPLDVIFLCRKHHLILHRRAKNKDKL